MNRLLILVIFSAAVLSAQNGHTTAGWNHGGEQHRAAAAEGKPVASPPALGVLIGLQLLVEDVSDQRPQPSESRNGRQNETQAPAEHETVHSNQAEADSPFQTIWIQISGQRVSIRLVQDLIVPRKTGFWRFGENTDSAHDGDQVATEDFFWAAPLEQRAKLAEVATVGCSSSESTKELDYIGPDYYAYSEFGEALCAHYGEGHYFGVRSLDDPNGKQFGLSELLGAIAHQQLRRLNHQATKWDNDCGTPGFAGREDQWTLRHSEGRWHAIVKLHGQGDGICDRYDEDRPLAVVLPGSLVHSRAVSLSWKAVKAAFPGAVDVFASPAGEVVLVFMPKKIVVASVTAGIIEKPFKEITIPNGKPVMAEWALGANVARWKSTLMALPGPNPTVKPRPPLP